MSNLKKSAALDRVIGGRSRASSRLFVGGKPLGKLLSVWLVACLVAPLNTAQNEVLPREALPGNRGEAGHDATTVDDTTTAPSDEADAWLERLEAAARSLHTYQARVTYTKIQPLQGDRQTRFALLLYQTQRAEADHPLTDVRATDDATTPNTPNTPNTPKFYIRFTAQQYLGRGIEKVDEVYVCDGDWLAERVIDEDGKRFKRWSMAEAERVADGDSGDDTSGGDASRGGTSGGGEGSASMFEFGEGPVPLPLGIKADRVRARYEVTMMHNDDGSARGVDADTPHLRLTARPQMADRLRYSEIDLWIDPDTNVPVRIEALVSEASGERAVVVFSNAKLNESLPDPDERAPSGGWFDTTPPDGAGWRVSETQ